MKEYSSFMSEHTAEFVLIPKLIDILRRKFEVVIPIFPWATREGNNFSKMIHEKDKFRILGLYPRRPKLNLHDHKTLIKINREFFDGANEASKINIPMIAGCPLARNLWELNEDTKCIWIKLTNRTKDYYIIEYNDEILPELKILQNEEVLKNNDDLLEFVIDKSKNQDFEFLIQAIRIIKSHGYTRFMGIGSYKPVYFLLKDNKE
jgi:hypothetical protein